MGGRALPPLRLRVLTNHWETCRGVIPVSWLSDSFSCVDGYGHSLCAAYHSLRALMADLAWRTTGRGGGSFLSVWGP